MPATSTPGQIRHRRGLRHANPLRRPAAARRALGLRPEGVQTRHPGGAHPLVAAGIGQARPVGQQRAAPGIGREQHHRAAPARRRPAATRKASCARSCVARQQQNAQRRSDGTGRRRNVAVMRTDRVIVACGPHSAQSGSGGSRTVRNRVASASQISSRPDSVSPMPRISFSTSVACSVPITPVTAPSTPASLQVGTSAGRRRFGIQAAVARAAGVRLEHRKLALEAQHRGRHQRAARQHAGVGHQKARGEIVGAVADDVVARDQRQRVVGGEPRGVRPRPARPG